MTGLGSFPYLAQVRSQAPDWTKSGCWMTYYDFRCRLGRNLVQAQLEVALQGYGPFSWLDSSLSTHVCGAIVERFYFHLLSFFIQDYLLRCIAICQMNSYLKAAVSG